jgi:sigma-B regulation protein RsbU (phosphoserine phosphatase)
MQHVMVLILNRISYLAMALGIFNLLLAAVGLMLVYFDWRAARSREFLYLFFNEEKPGFNYFAAARRRRAQYSRLLIAFFILFLRDFLVAVQYASVSKPDDWKEWVLWWGSNWWKETTSLETATAFASELQVWIYCLGILGVVLLGLGFLYRPRVDKAAIADLISVTFVTVWVVFMGIVASGRLDHALPIVHMVVTITRTVALPLIVLCLLRHKDERVEQGLLNYDSATIALAFMLWLGGMLASDWMAQPALAPVLQVVAYLIIVATVGRAVLNEYELVEGSRHRLGRERQVIVSFLRSIGAAFTEDVEVDSVLRIILDSALETTEASAGAIYLFAKDRQVLEPRIVLNFFPPMHVDTPAAYSAHRTDELEEEMKHQSFALNEGIIGEVAAKGQARIIEDVRAEGIMLGSTTDYMRNRSMLIVPLRLRDEPLGVMAVLNKQRGSFNPEDRSLLQALADQGALFINNALLTGEVAAQERLRRDLQIARDIQHRLLPDKCPVVPGFEIGAHGTSATEVGGDYYDFFWVDDDKLGIVVADVSGKGVHAALIAAMIRSAFRSQARGNPDVRAVLAGVNDFISQDLRSDMFITCIYGILDVPSKTFSWARAGHEPIIVAHSDQETDVLSPDGFALGVIEGPEFAAMLEIQTTDLQSGDRLLIFTDGLTEAMNSAGEEFGMERILEVMDHHETQPLNGANGYTARETAARNGEANGASTLAAGRSRAMKLQLSKNPSDTTEPEQEDPEDLKTMERAVQSHVNGAPQSDDLTIVYLAAK